MGKLTVYLDRIASSEQDPYTPTAVLLFRMADGVYQEWLVPLQLLPNGVREGDVLRLTFEPDPQARAELKERIDNLMADLFDATEPDEDSGSQGA